MSKYKLSKFPRVAKTLLVFNCLLSSNGYIEPNFSRMRRELRFDRQRLSAKKLNEIWKLSKFSHKAVDSENESVHDYFIDFVNE